MSIFINNQEVYTMLFPGGECNVRVNPTTIKETNEVEAFLWDSNDIINLMLSIDAIHRINPESHINLTIPYFPYARQDRVCNTGEALSLKVMTDMINNLHCDTVTILDPHSDVTPALLHRCKSIHLAQLIANSPLKEIIQAKKLSLLSPDAGAEKKIREVSKNLATLQIFNDVIYATKTRNTATGEITGTEIHGDVKNKNIIIMDDICDGGRTFVELAKKLKMHDAAQIYLYVTHGIFSKGFEELKEYFTHIYCYHTKLTSTQANDTFLTIFNKAN